MKNNEKLWLIGFIEAEGCLHISTKNQFIFTITQGYRNIHILYYIQEILGIGKVIKQGSKTFRYVVQDKVGIKEIIKLLNGNLYLEIKKEQLKLFIEKWNEKYPNQEIIYKDLNYKPNLQDAWISGFTDGDGCFNISYILTKKRFYIRYLLSQKQDLREFIEIFGVGSIEYNKSNQCYTFVIKDMETKEKDQNMVRVFKYFKEFPLKTSKLNSYKLFEYLAGQLWDKKTLTEQKKAGIKTLIKLINE